MPRFAPSAGRRNVIGATIAGLIVVASCMLLLAHDPLIFWNDDYEISILPVFADMARAWNHGEIPLLSPYSWVCGNLAGEFQYGVFSIFINALIVCVWKLPLTCTPRGPRCRRIFALARPETIDFVIYFCRARRVAERLDHLLGCKRLVWGARRIHLAAVGLVGSEAGA